MRSPARPLHLHAGKEGTMLLAARDARWKIIRYPLVDVTELFDLENDPCEMKNLADDPAPAAWQPPAPRGGRGGAAPRRRAAGPAG